MFQPTDTAADAVKVRAKADMFFPAEGANMVNMPQKIRNFRRLLSFVNKRRVKDDVNRSILFNKRSDLVVVQIAGMIAHCSRIGVAGERIIGKLDDIPKTSHR